MSRVEKFAFLAAILGFIVDTITLALWAMGFVHIPRERGLLANPFVITIISIPVILITLVALLYFILQLVENRWVQYGKMPSTSTIRHTIQWIAAVVWFPVSLLWGIAIIRIFWTYYEMSLEATTTSGTIADPIIWLLVTSMLYFVFVVPVGWLILAYVAVTTRDFFSPTGNFANIPYLWVFHDGFSLDKQEPFKDTFQNIT
jgi:hypothetical protein